MKRFIVYSVLFGTMQLFAQDISCVEFAMMSSREASNMATQFEKKIDLKLLGDINLQKNTDYINAIHEESRHINICLNLRDAYNREEVDFLRIKALRELSKSSLSRTEKKMYLMIIDENRMKFEQLSHASLTEKKACRFPLLYLSSEETEKGLLVYESRLVKHEIKTFHIYVNPDKHLKLRCGGKATKKKYIEYLNDNGAHIPIVATKVEKKPKDNNDIYSPDYVRSQHKTSQKSKHTHLGKYAEAQHKFTAVDFLSSKKIIIHTGALLENIEKEGQEIFFIHKAIKFRVAEYTFTANTKAIKDKK